MAKQRGCHLELLLRNPSKPVDLNYDMHKVIKLLEEITEQAKPAIEPEVGTSNAPAPRSKGE